MHWFLFLLFRDNYDRCGNRTGFTLKASNSAEKQKPLLLLYYFYWTPGLPTQTSSSSLRSSLLFSLIAHVVIPNQVLNTIFLSFSPNTSQPTMISFNSCPSMPFSHPSFLGLTAQNIPLGDAEHMAEQTAAVCSGSSMLEVSTVVEPS